MLSASKTTAPPIFKRVSVSRRSCKSVTVLLVVLSLSGCTRFIYNHVDWVIRWEISDYVDFNRDQRKVLNKVLDDTLAWHRASELPRYEQYLVRVRREFQSTTTQEQFAQLLDELLTFWQDILAQSMPNISRLLGSLDDNQVATFIKNLQDEQDDYLKDLKDESERERLDERAKDFAHTIQRFTGKLNDEQRAMLSDWAQDTNGILAVSLTQRQHWQDELGKTLAIRNSDPERFRRELYALFVTPEKYWSVQYRRLIDYHRHKTAQVLAQLQASLTDKQRKKLDKTLAKYQRDIALLQNKK